MSFHSINLTNFFSHRPDIFICLDCNAYKNTGRIQLSWILMFCIVTSATRFDVCSMSICRIVAEI